MEILLKELFALLLSFLKAIYRYQKNVIAKNDVILILPPLASVEFHTQTQSLELVQQHVERLWYARCWHRLALNNGLIGAGAAHHII